MSCNNKIDHVTEGLSKLISQYQGKTRIINWITSALKQIQDIEDVSFDLCNAFNIDTAVGDQLTSVGKIVGQQRFGLSDESLRALVLTRILVNKTSGTAPEFIEILLALDPTAVYEEHYAASIFVYLNADLSNQETRNIYRDILFSAKPAGVELWAIDRSVTDGTPFRISNLYDTTINNSPRGFGSVHGTPGTGAGEFVTLL